MELEFERNNKFEGRQGWPFPKPFEKPSVTLSKGDPYYR